MENMEGVNYVSQPAPEQATNGAAGLDIRAATSMTLKPGKVSMIPTGWGVELPLGYEMQVRPRSSMAKEGLIIPNSPGTIDSDYRGEICVLMMPLGNKSVTINAGDRIAQAVVCAVADTYNVFGELGKTRRGSGGFGSTGV